MRTYIYLTAAIACLLYGSFYSNEHGLITIGFLFVILADINDIKEKLNQHLTKKP
jgi:hypothetical protein